MTEVEKLLRAIEDGDVTVMDCKLRDTGEPVKVLCTVETDADGAIKMTPVAGLFSSNPYDLLLPGDYNEQKATPAA
jgi:hypothetical protein